MKVRYWLLQYVDDIERVESRNFAVVAVGGSHRLAYRFLGDLRPRRARFDCLEALCNGHRVTSSWVFREWIHWLDTLCGENDEELVGRAMACLAEGRHPQFIALEEEAELDDEELRRWHPVNLLYTRLVGDPFEEQVERIFGESKLEFTAELDASVAVEAEGMPTLHFDFLARSRPPRRHAPPPSSAIGRLSYSARESAAGARDGVGAAGVLVGFKVFRAGGRSGEQVIQSLNDLLFTRGTILGRRDGGVRLGAVLTDAPEHPGLEGISLDTPIINVWDRRTALELLRASMGFR